MALRYLLDSDACVAFLNGGSVAVRGRWLDAGPSDIATCSVVKAELLAGAWKSRDPLAMCGRIERMLGPMRSLAFDDRAAEVYGEIAAHLERHGNPIQVPDAMIAAIALCHDLTVVTRNVKHFRRVKGVRVVAW